jgi:hypothetical protein
MKNLLLPVAFALISSNLHAQKFPDVDKSPMDMASFPTDYKDAAKIARDNLADLC